MTFCVALYVCFGCLQALRGQSYFRGSCWILLVYRCLGECFEVFRSAHDWKGVILRVSTIHLGLLLRSLIVGDQTVLFFVMAKMCGSSFRDLDDARNFPHAIKMDSNVH